MAGLAGGDGPVGIWGRGRADLHPNRAVLGPPDEWDMAENGSPAWLAGQVAPPRRSRKGNLRANPLERVDLLERGRPGEGAGRILAECPGAVLVVQVRGSRVRGRLVKYRAGACARVLLRGL